MGAFAKSFVSNRTVIRRKSFMEVWTEIGGAWASALLLITFFFAKKTGGSGEGVQVCKFQTPSGRKEVTKELMKKLGESLKKNFEEDIETLKQDVEQEAASSVGKVKQDVEQEAA